MSYYTRDKEQEAAYQLAKKLLVAYDADHNVIYPKQHLLDFLSSQAVVVGGEESPEIIPLKAAVGGRLEIDKALLHLAAIDAHAVETQGFFTIQGEDVIITNPHLIEGFYLVAEELKDMQLSGVSQELLSFTNYLQGKQGNIAGLIQGAIPTEDGGIIISEATLQRNGFNPDVWRMTSVHNPQAVEYIQGDAGPVQFKISAEQTQNLNEWAEDMLDPDSPIAQKVRQLQAATVSVAAEPISFFGAQAQAARKRLEGRRKQASDKGNSQER